MAFIVKTVPDVTVPVEIMVPGDEAPSRIHARWKLHNFDQFQERMKLAGTGDITDEQLIREDLVHAGPFHDEEGNELPFSHDLVVELLQQTFFRTALIASWYPAQQGRVEAVAKN